LSHDTHDLLLLSSEHYRSEPQTWLYSVLLWNKKESKKDIKYLRETSHHFLLPCLRKCPTVLSISPKGWIWTPNLGFKFQPPP
jgi:hypothetical protein